MEVKVVDKVWGRELWIVNNDKYCGKILELRAGFRCSYHYHKEKEETFYVLDGKILMEVDREKRVMGPGKIQHIKPYQKHRFTGLENSRIIEFSTHHEDSDSYRDTKSEKVNLCEILRELKSREIEI